jgi:hypothetical protein
MAGRLWSCIRALQLILLAALSAGLAGASPPAPAVKAGQVIEWRTRKPLVVEVGAWAGEEKAPAGGCPTFATPLTSARSDAQGRFLLRLKEDTTFQVSFCASEYFPRTEPQPAGVGGGAVLPLPVVMYPRGADAEAFRTAVAETVRSFVSDLVYLAQSRPEVFREAVEELDRRPELRDFRREVNGLRFSLTEIGVRAAPRASHPR